MQIRKLIKDDILGAAIIISKTFESCNILEGTKDGVKGYIDFYNPALNKFEIIESSFNRTPYSFILEEDNIVIGIIRGTETRIVNLFVDPNYHGKGYGKKLLARFEEEVFNLGSSFIKIKASLFATKFYEKAGYKKTTGIRNFRGLKMQPMIKKIK